MNRKQKETQKLKITCITELVDSWFQILVGGNHIFWQKSEVNLGFIDCYFVLCFVCRNISYENSVSSITCLCLDIIGAYIEWTDIGLIANDRFIR